MSPTSSADFEDRIKRAAALTAEIKALEPKYQAISKELTEKRGQLAELFGLDPEAEGLTGEAFVRGIANSKGSNTSKILAALKANKGKPMSAEEVAAMIKLEDVNSVRALLSRLSHRGEAKKVKRGRYMYPG
jgi:hypothetical protein